ncbi:MAG TPA: hypothetical protein VGJ05_12030 [Fimbriiglobus sp.]|jgi:hypothetical protein
MSDAQTFVRSLYTAPGRVVAGRDGLLDRAAAAHATLFALARTRAGPSLLQALAPIDAYLSGPSPPAEKRRLLCHPLFIEGLHALAPFSAELQRWHDRVTSCPHRPPPDPAAVASLGNVALEIRLRADRTWSGRCDLYTDVLGRIGFPFCDWSVYLPADRDQLPAGRAVSLMLDPSRAFWRLGGRTDDPFLIMPRNDCLRMLVDNDGTLDNRNWTFPDAAVRPKLVRACRLGRSAIRYDPVGIPTGTAHAGITGGLLARIVEAIRRDSPAIYREFRHYIRAIRGFEFPRAKAVASFSDPTLPGVMGVSVAYSDADEPCLDPFCFTWFGHEMGHTKDYLCDTILYARGESLVTNCGEWTAPIPRYGRPLSIRTLIQIPYVHLYEWTLLMDFWQANFRGLPWAVTGGAAEVGNDCAAEIEESFDLIDAHADLTPVGVAAVRHFHELYAEANDRWQTVRTLA